MLVMFWLGRFSLDKTLPKSKVYMIFLLRPVKNIVDDVMYIYICLLVPRDFLLTQDQVGNLD